MEELLHYFGSKAAISRALNISGTAVVRAFNRGKVPTQWVPALKKAGLTKTQLKNLPLSGNGNEIVNAITKG
jgi:DNA invertase Pin-like site-specific DNA recombinase